MFSFMHYVNYVTVLHLLNIFKTLEIRRILNVPSQAQRAFERLHGSLKVHVIMKNACIQKIRM